MATGDRRDAQTWVVLELAKTGETALEDGSLTERLLGELGVDPDWPLFVPAVSYAREGRRITIHLMEGYVFVASGLPDVDFYKLEDLSYINQIMSTKQGPYRMRTLHVVSNNQVKAMRARLIEQVTSNIQVGACVVIKEGQYRNLDGRVIGIEGDNAHVRVTLRSLDFVASVPRIFLEEQIEHVLDES